MLAGLQHFGKYSMNSLFFYFSLEKNNKRGSSHFGLIIIANSVIVLYKIYSPRASYWKRMRERNTVDKTREVLLISIFFLFNKS